MELNYCRICKSPNLENVIDLGYQSLASIFPKNTNEILPVSPLILTKCKDCNLVQLKHTLPMDDMYKSMVYGYRSGLNATMTEHLRNMVEDILSIVTLNDGEVVLDIGSNDGTLLKNYSTQGLIRIGIDPTGLQFKDYYPSDVSLVPDYFNKENYYSAIQGKAKIITSISMFYDLPDPVNFMKDIKAVLHDDGVWIMEQSYMPTMLESHSFDTICHEHLEYYGLQQIKYMTNLTDLRIFKVEFNSCNGGSFRVFICHQNASYGNLKDTAEINTVLESEEVYNNTECYTVFMNKCDKLKAQLKMLLCSIKKQGKTVYLYGASTKGNTLLQYYSIDNMLISGAAERNTDKYSKFTPSTNIPIMSEEQVRNAKPDYMLVLPWHFREEFLEREKEYLKNGGQFIFPLPSIEIVSNKPIALITGITGQIGHYLVNLLYSKGYQIYGTTRGIVGKSDKYTLLEGDIGDIITVLNPVEIYHLAAETDSLNSINYPLETINSNGVLTAKICERLPINCKLFVANSTELFKGSQAKIISEDTMENYMYPRTPYSIGKNMSYWAARYYREQNSKFICSGILTNTESKLRRSCYVTKKIINGIKNKEVLTLENLNIYRDWIHASDVANAAWLILNQETPKDYIISTGKLTSLKEFINMTLNKMGIVYEWGGDICTSNGEVIIINKNEVRSYELNNGDCVFNNDLLKSINWVQQFELEDIIIDMI
jgi:NDP-4-keto-2,6-dideoxyhexose 3-C-methyltransferase